MAYLVKMSPLITGAALRVKPASSSPKVWASISMFGAQDQTRAIALLSGFPVLMVTVLVPSMSWTLFLLPIEIAALLLRRHYATVVLLLSIATLLAVVAATVWLLPVLSRMDQETRFDWDRWHWIWLSAAYVTGWGHLLAITIIHFANRFESRRSLRPGV